MRIVQTISVDELKKMAERMYGSIVKGVIDIAKDELVLDAEMHVDEEQYLLERGSKQADLWGINLHPDLFGTKEFVEFDSMINIRPRQQNMSRSVENPEIRKQIVDLVNSKVVQ